MTIKAIVRGYMKYNYTVKQESIDRLIPLKFIFIFSGVMILMFVGFFPGFSLKKELLSPFDSTVISLYYLNRYVADHPTDIEMRVALAQQEIEQYHFDKAKVQIETLKQTKAASYEPQLLTFYMTYTQGFLIKDKQAKDAQFVKLRQEVNAIKTLPLRRQDLIKFAPIALGLGKPGIALHFYEPLVRDKAPADPESFRKITKIAMQDSQYKVAAKYLHLAMKHEVSMEKKRADSLAILTIYQNGHLFDEGIAFISSLPDQLIDQKNMLVKITEFLLYANRPELAEIYIKRALTVKGKIRGN
jgi:hypothetical protein